MIFNLNRKLLKKNRKKILIKLGIPEKKIVLDYAGFRTFDSVIRSKEIFGQNSITIISQNFHNERAVFIARKNNIRAIAFNAKNVGKYYGYKTMLREKFARVKTILDIYFLNTKPKFLGEKIKIGVYHSSQTGRHCDGEARSNSSWLRRFEVLPDAQKS